MIEAMRLALAFLPENSTAVAILATLPVAIAAVIRTRSGESPVAPDPTLGTAADLLCMIHGRPVAEPMVSALDTYLTSVIDNGLNAHHIEITLNDSLGLPDMTIRRRLIYDLEPASGTAS